MSSLKKNRMLNMKGDSKYEDKLYCVACGGIFIPCYIEDNIHFYYIFFCCYSDDIISFKGLYILMLIQIHIHAIIKPFNLRKK